ncbi:MAG: diacylglycerol kinase family lipid kinase [Bacteroidales bacterium]|nr:diacylglycerol kinase family lipid kinase [Bacteroidales bacterium]
MKEENDWLIIVNPNAGMRKGVKEWHIISEKLSRKNISFFSVFTEHKMHAIYLTQKYIEAGFRKIIVVGGDGTLHEVINGVMTQNICPSTDITVGIIPVGTGNDWCKTFGITQDYDEAIDVIIRGKTFLHDLGKVSYTENGEPKERYIINSAGIGFEAFVVRATNKQKETGKSHPILYLYNVLRYFTIYKGRHVSLDMDGEKRDISFYLFSIGVCKYKGNGMKLLPYAIPDDGLLDITVFRRANIFVLLRNIIRAVKGKLDKIKIASSYKAKRVVVDSKTEKLIMEVDGESLGNNPYVFETVPAAIYMVINNITW